MPRAIFRPLNMLLSLALVGALCIAGLLLYYHFAHDGRAFPGVRMRGTDLGGMYPEEIFFIAQSHKQFYISPSVKLRVGERVFTYRPAELGASLDPAETTRIALQTGREGNWLNQARDRLAIWWRGAEVAPVVLLDENAIRRAIQHIAQQVEQPALDAELTIAGNQVQSRPAQTGLDLDEESAVQLVRMALLRGQPAELELPHRLIAPALLRVDEAEQTLRTMLRSDVIVMLPRWDAQGNPLEAVEAFRIRATDLPNFILIERTTADGRPQLNVRVLREQLRPLVLPLARSVEQPGQNARFTFNPKTKQLNLLAPHRERRELNVEATLDALEAAIRSADQRLAIVVVNRANPPVTSQATAQALGITTLITQATTYFRGSSAARLNNIRVAAERFHGVLIPPGSVFSFNDVLGDVTEASGFTEGLIIVGDRTVKGIGGGVCQVSTTMYQAALRAGLPIVERHPHGYRVSYYERGMGPGFDAAVFTPWADLKFRNNTPAYLLIETQFNQSQATLTFRLYGTPDNREVIISNATLSEIVPHGPDVYEPAPEKKVPPGKAKQVEFAVDGATASFTRQVIRNGEVLINERVVSRYVPWQNVFHYGEGFKPPPGAIVKSAPTP
ncbi:MAG: VanW family protein [Thermoflexales bacterium]